ncbi:predicted protein [Sclerotinia sclerotiorum 1980 UF-70]|uniref:Uncharacterized protein n=1 Tax=Sclerotinia sclerotiorum (strain ATCC 18683 / 1980 / Ss-1) TaxID=665079 RepID=A7F3E2_SCLS1|nr:predicted protein [Sclerotinia sclerotiorum 1980 UF-70]EDN97263.1 predicted protein [Sclerotinia sclerotiorum 1980 UF-70]
MKRSKNKEKRMKEGVTLDMFGGRRKWSVRVTCHKDTAELLKLEWSHDRVGMSAGQCRTGTCYNQCCGVMYLKYGRCLCEVPPGLNNRTDRLISYPYKR